MDDEKARAAAGGDFAAPVPAKDAEGTRHNMLGEKLLDAAQLQPVHEARVRSHHPAGRSYQAQLRVSLRGEEHVVAAPFTVTIEGAHLQAHANLHLRMPTSASCRSPSASARSRCATTSRSSCRLEARRGSVTSIRFRNPEVRISAALAAAAAAVRDPVVTLRELFALLGEQGLLVFCGVLAAPFLLPVTCRA